MVMPPLSRHVVLGVLGGLLAVALTVFTAAATAVKLREYRTIGSTPVERTLTVSGIGTVRAVPDLASISAGVTVEESDAARAQSEGNRLMRQVTDAVVGVGIPDLDLQTSDYSVYPRYEYPNTGDRILRGYTASQSVTVTIRNLDLVNAVLDALRTSGATNVGALQFTLDDPEQFHTQARTDAIADARVRAQNIATLLDVRLGPVTYFSESGGAQPPVFLDYALGMGGAAEKSAPDIQTGENNVVVSVSVTYRMD
ncbi:MAG: SIMPL domain-containing protein [bacterium]|nr:SIMPL domain-containing protein [bacterium]